MGYVTWYSSNDGFMDECGACDSDTSNDCVQACNGVWGGDNEGWVVLWDLCFNIEETTYLNLSNYGLSGEIPSEIGNLINLTSIRLSENNLSGEIPSSIGNLTNLNSLRLYNNQLTGEIPSSI